MPGYVSRLVWPGDPLAGSEIWGPVGLGIGPFDGLRGLGTLVGSKSSVDWVDSAAVGALRRESVANISHGTD